MSVRLGKKFSAQIYAALRRSCRLGSLIESLEPRMLLSIAPANVLVNHGDPLNNGTNLNETILTLADVNSASFGKEFTATLDGQLYAQVLEVANVNITRGSSQGIHNVLYAATMHDSLYAVDADTGVILWQDSFLQTGNPEVTGSVAATAGVTTVPVKSGDNAIIASVLGPELGILSTPTIDASTGIIYLETNTQEFRNGVTPTSTFTVGTTDIHYVQRLWALNISNGAVGITPTNNPSVSVEPTTGGQIIGDTIFDPTGTNTVPSFTSYTGYKYVAGPYIKGTGDNGNFVAGTGDSASEDGWAVNTKDTTSPWGSQGETPMQVGDIAFNAIIQMNRVALTEVDGTIFIGFASHGDDGPYYGFLLGYNATTLANTIAFVTAPTFEDFSTVSGDRQQFDAQAGLWSAGGSISTDGTYLYVTTGNGAFNPNASNFNSTYTSNDHGNTVQMPLDNDYGNAVLKLAIDPSATQGNINVASGILSDPDGTYSPDAGYNANGYGLSVVDYFVPSNTLYLNLQDEDLNAGGVLLIPNSITSTVPGHVGDPMLVAGGKEGRMYLIDRDDLGGFNFNYPSNVDGSGNPVLGPDPSTYDRVLGEYYYFETLNPGTTSGTETDRAYTTPSYFNGDVYFGLSGAPELGIPLSDFSTGTSPPGSGVFPTPNFKTSNTFTGEGTTATITANGSSNAIIWNINETSSSSDSLVAYSGAATGIVSSLYSSPTSGTGSLTAGVSGATGVKFSVPTVTNGLVYVGTGGGTGTGGHILGTIVGFGLLSPTLHTPTSPAATATSTTSIHLTWSLTSGDQESEMQVQRFNTATSAWVVVQNLSTGSTSYDDTGLTPGTQYQYRLVEIYGTHSSTVSATATATTPSMIPATLLSAVSRQPEAGAGNVDLNLPLLGAPGVEPCIGGPTTVIFTFNRPVVLSSSFALSLTSGTGTAVASGSTVTVTLSGATNEQILTINLSNVQDQATGALGNYSIQVNVLAGDVDRSGTVDIFDLNIVAAFWQQAITSPASGDLNGDGVVNIADLNAVAGDWQGTSGGGSGESNAQLAAVVSTPSISSAGEPAAKTMGGTVVPPIVLSSSLITTQPFQNLFWDDDLLHLRFGKKR